MSPKEDILEFFKLSGIIFAIIFSIILIGCFIAKNNESPVGPETNEKQTIIEKKEITIEDAQKFVGLRIKDICPKYKGYNVHPYHGGKMGTGGFPCDETVVDRFYYNYVITQVYTDNEDNRDPKMIYIDSLSEEEAIEAGIKIK